MATFDGGAEADHLACMTTHRITPQVLEVLALLARYRYLRKSFIDGLLPHRSADGMNRTLKRLRAQGYVSLPREQFRGYNSLYCCYIYQITPKGLLMVTKPVRPIMPKVLPMATKPVRPITSKTRSMNQMNRPIMTSGPLKAVTPMTWMLFRRECQHLVQSTSFSHFWHMRLELW